MARTSARDAADSCAAMARSHCARFATLAVIVALLASCASAPPPPRPPERPIAPVLPPTLNEAIDFASDDLFVQMLRLPAMTAPAMGGASPAAVVVVDALIDGVTGQQTKAAEYVQQRLVDRIRGRFVQVVVRPASSATVDGAQYLLVGTISRAPEGANLEHFKLNLSLTDIRSGFVIAQAASRVRDPGVDTTPTAFYRDVPTNTKDRIVDGYIKTAETPAGGAADAVYLQGVPTASVLNDAIGAYNAGRYDDAYNHYKVAASRPDGQQLRVLNGLYLASEKLGRRSEAETAFGRIVALGLATNNLGMMILFRPGSTEFATDAGFSEQYPMWLRQIAVEAVKAGGCLQVIGHTSKTGAEAYNDRLSLQRALTIKRRLEIESRELVNKVQASGVGWRETLVGIGTDDARDAPDRRVEFKRRPC